MKRLILVALIIFVGTLAAAQNVPEAGNASAAAVTVSGIKLPSEKANPVHIPRFEKPPVIDGKLDDEVWQHAALLKDFYQTSPGDNIAPSKKTEAMIGYDAKFLYFAFHCYDEPGKVRATVAKRDQVFGEDNVRVFLDTFNDQRRAYILGWNPLGVQQDGIYTEGSGNDFSVDIVMESKGMITDDGWTLEVAIPFKSLRYTAGKDKLWGVHIWRNIDRFNDEIDSWMPISRDKSGTLNQTGHLTGLEGISTERTIELIPSLTLSETGKRIRSIPSDVLDANPNLIDPGRFLNQPIKFDPGLTAKFGITPTITLDLALNPDFAQVEADQTVVTANQRFPIFFEEKRPFFLEGIDYFQTPLTILHTRAIVDPDVAVKLTGKRGRNTFGLLLASDNAPGNFSEDERTDPDILPGIRRFLDKNAYIGVLRLKHDIGKENSLGMIATTYNFIEKHNDVLGVDGRFRVNPQTIFSFQAVGTSSRRCFSDPKADRVPITALSPCFNGSSTTRNFYRTGNAFGYYWNYNSAGRHFGYQLNGQGRTRDYRADVGFTRRTNTNYEEIFLRYNSEPKPKAKIISYRVFNSSRTNFDWQGHSQVFEDEAQLQVNLQHTTQFGFGYVGGYERLFEEEFGPKRTLTHAGAFFGNDPERSTFQNSFYAFGFTQPSKKYSANLFMIHTAGAFDLDFGAGPRFPRISPAALANPNAALDPGPGGEWNLNASINYKPTNSLSTSLDYTKDRLRRNDTGRLAFNENILTLRATYQFTRFMFARARIDYDTLASDVRGQFLLGWTPNPGTSFYIGYNDDSSRNGFNPFTGNLEPGFRRNGRTFFVKMSYLFRKSF
jgi:hypothetical protein